jgi:hypothetical protein
MDVVTLSQGSDGVISKLTPVGENYEKKKIYAFQKLYNSYQLFTLSGHNSNIHKNSIISNL